MCIRDRIGSDKEASDHVITFASHGKDFRLKDQGLGVRNIAGFANTLASDIKVFLIDEPEVSLHPQVQRRLFRKLWELSAGKQIIVSTHSPHFVNWSMVNSGKVYRFVKDKNGDATVKCIANSTVESLKVIVQSDLKNRKLYDSLSREIFFCDTGVVFCEGQEDVHYIENYLENGVNAPQIDLPLFGYGSGGASNINKWLQLADELNIRAVGLYDGDEDINAEQARKQFKDVEGIKVLQIEKPDIRDKYKRDEKGKKIKPLEVVKEGVFKESGDMKPELKVTFDAVLIEASEHIDS